ncbi:MAG: NAD(+)/NADH kinase [Acidobacteria bacterium]|nr:NAD(+)/NADH kinase [Acidobacteriota bacterium]
MIRKVGIISKPRKEDLAAVVPRLLEWLRAHNLEAFYDKETAASIAPGGPIRQAQGKPEVPREELPAKTDMIILLGGDGTLLAAARMMGDSSVPILPVNLGGLGFLTSVTLDELYAILEEVLAGRHRVSERVLLEAEVVRGGQVIERQRALNDAVLNKAALARIIDLELLIEGGYVCSYKADGLIVSTPTGSTAYSLAAGGPIVYPVLDAFVITPICPHSLTNRPLVIPDSMRIEIDFHCGDESVFLTIDGQVGIELKEGDRIAIRKAPSKLRLIRPVKKTYFQILRNKLKWGGR